MNLPEPLTVFDIVGASGDASCPVSVARVVVWNEMYVQSSSDGVVDMTVHASIVKSDVPTSFLQNFTNPVAFTAAFLGIPLSIPRLVSSSPVA